jgi:hypothetical protein
VAQACAALTAQLSASPSKPTGAALGSRKKGRGKADGGSSAAAGGFSAAGKRLSIEIPVMDDSPAGAVQLAQELLAGLPPALRRQFTVVSTGAGAAAAAGFGAAGGGGAPVVSLEQCVASRRVLPGCVLLAGPSAAQMVSVAAALSLWSGPAAVVLNPGWAAAAADEPEGGGGGMAPGDLAFARSFLPIYVFMPVALKASPPPAKIKNGVHLRVRGRGLLPRAPRGPCCRRCHGRALCALPTSTSAFPGIPLSARI